MVEQELRSDGGKTASNQRRQFYQIFKSLNLDNFVCNMEI